MMEMPHELSSPAPAQAAAAAGLRYATDRGPGLRRELQRKGFVYRDEHGRLVREAETLRRIRKLAVPPAWTDVWISPRENDHLQATGRDARGRKQYRYHPAWREERAANKFAHMVAFARALPALRRRVRRDCAARGMPRTKVLATVVQLLESTLIRVGNEEYARQNHSYGLTTMKSRHARVRGATIEFGFRGKSGKRHAISVTDPQLARIVRRCQEMPGQELFTYEDESGEARKVTSQDVNEYLQEVTGQHFTAKDFRTWAGTVLAAIALRELAIASQVTQAKRNITSAIEAVARLLGNTPAVCRQSYIHPAVLDSYLAGRIIPCAAPAARRRPAALQPHEKAVLALLRAAARVAGIRR